MAMRRAELGRASLRVRAARASPDGFTARQAAERVAMTLAAYAPAARGATLAEQVFTGAALAA